MLMNCIASLKASEPRITFNVVLVESSQYMACGQDRTIDYDTDTFCYNHALNLGIKSTTNEWVILANNDLIFHPFFMTAILDEHRLDSSIKSFSPWNPGYHDCCMSGDRDLFVGSRVCYELAGWCIVCRRELLEAINLSEHVDFWYSDNIYADEIVRHGFKHALVRVSVVNHLCSRTIDFTTYDSTIDLKKYLEKK